jgi:uncharacterized membrane protein YfcA
MGSLLVSLPTVVVGVPRFASRDTFADRQALAETIAAMRVGSLIGAVAGGMLVGSIRAAPLKIVLGLIVNVSAVRLFPGKHATHGSEANSTGPKG